MFARQLACVCVLTALPLLQLGQYVAVSADTKLYVFGVPD